MRPIPPSELTPAQIVAREQSEGKSAWTGPNGNADAWQLVSDYFNVDSHSFINTCTTLGAALGRLG